MSGGSMDYLYYKVREATFTENTPERKALRKHLLKLAKALQAVEWNDSGDGADDESQLIREALGDTAILEAAVQQAKEAHKDLTEALGRVEGSWLSKEMQTPPKGFPAIKPVEEPLGSWEPIATAPKYTTVLCRYDPTEYGDETFKAEQDQFGEWTDVFGDTRCPDEWFKEAPK